MVSFTPDELIAYRAKKDQEKADVEKERTKTADAKAKEASQRRRTELEVTLKNRFLVSGGTELEWSRVKARVLEDALAKATLEPDPEPEPKKRVPLPMAKSRYRN